MSEKVLALQKLDSAESSTPETNLISTASTFCFSSASFWCDSAISW